MSDAVRRLLALLAAHDGINDKARLARIVREAFRLTQVRSVYSCADFAIRFSSSDSRTFGNTVLSLASLQKYDDRPFLVCVVMATENWCLLANSTLLKKISHSSQDLRENNIRGSFNGSDIARELDGIANSPENFARLFDIHAGVGFEGNLARLVEATSGIAPTGVPYRVTEQDAAVIRAAPERASRFMLTKDYSVLKEELDAQMRKYQPEILMAAHIEDVNVRGRAIEYLIAGEDGALRDELAHALRVNDQAIPKLRTDHSLGDYHRSFSDYDTETDVKTKIMTLASNPKAYNLDKMLRFLANPRSVFLCYFLGIDPGRRVKTVLVSMFQERLLHATVVLKHWSGRNSRGVTQFDGAMINDLIARPDATIDFDAAHRFLKSVIDL